MEHDLPHSTYTYSESVPTLFPERIAYLQRELTIVLVTHLAPTPCGHPHYTGPHLERTQQSNGVPSGRRYAAIAPSYVHTVLASPKKRRFLVGVHQAPVSVRLFVQMHQQLT